jgi:hypothetical protein
VGRGKGISEVRGKGTKLGEGCPKVRLSQDRMPIFPPHLAYYVRFFFEKTYFKATFL